MSQDSLGSEIRYLRELAECLRDQHAFRVWVDKKVGPEYSNAGRQLYEKLVRSSSSICAFFETHLSGSRPVLQDILALASLLSTRAVDVIRVLEEDREERGTQYSYEYNIDGCNETLDHVPSMIDPEDIVNPYSTKYEYRAEFIRDSMTELIRLLKQVQDSGNFIQQTPVLDRLVPVTTGPKSFGYNYPSNEPLRRIYRELSMELWLISTTKTSEDTFVKVLTTNDLSTITDEERIYVGCDTALFVYVWDAMRYLFSNPKNKLFNDYPIFWSKRSIQIKASNLESAKSKYEKGSLPRHSKAVDDFFKKLGVMIMTK